jgi:hypothetical protein
LPLAACRTAAPPHRRTAAPSVRRALGPPAPHSPGARYRKRGAHPPFARTLSRSQQLLPETRRPSAAARTACHVPGNYHRKRDVRPPRPPPPVTFPAVITPRRRRAATAPPRHRATAPPRHRTTAPPAAPPHRRTAAPPHRRRAARPTSAARRNPRHWCRTRRDTILSWRHHHGRRSRPRQSVRITFLVVARRDERRVESCWPHST